MLFWTSAQQQRSGVEELWSSSSSSSYSTRTADGSSLTCASTTILGHPPSPHVAVAAVTQATIPAADAEQRAAIALRAVLLQKAVCTHGAVRSDASCSCSFTSYTSSDYTSCCSCCDSTRDDGDRSRVEPSAAASLQQEVPFKHAMELLAERMFDLDGPAETGPPSAGGTVPPPPPDAPPPPPPPPQDGDRPSAAVWACSIVTAIAVVDAAAQTEAGPKPLLLDAQVGCGECAGKRVAVQTDDADELLVQLHRATSSVDVAWRQCFRVLEDAEEGSRAALRDVERQLRGALEAAAAADATAALLHATRARQQQARALQAETDRFALERCRQHGVHECESRSLVADAEARARDALLSSAVAAVAATQGATVRTMSSDLDGLALDLAQARRELAEERERAAQREALLQARLARAMQALVDTRRSSAGAGVLGHEAGGGDDRHAPSTRQLSNDAGTPSNAANATAGAVATRSQREFKTASAAATTIAASSSMSIAERFARAHMTAMTAIPISTSR